MTSPEEEGLPYFEDDGEIDDLWGELRMSALHKGESSPYFA